MPKKWIGLRVSVPGKRWGSGVSKHGLQIFSRRGAKTRVTSCKSFGRKLLHEPRSKLLVSLEDMGSLVRFLGLWGKPSESAFHVPNPKWTFDRTDPKAAPNPLPKPRMRAHTRSTSRPACQPHRNPSLELQKKEKNKGTTCEKGWSGLIQSSRVRLRTHHIALAITLILGQVEPPTTRGLGTAQTICAKRQQCPTRMASITLASAYRKVHGWPALA